MTNIDQLFCTPYQGKRLKELVPELESVFVWVNLRDHNHMFFWHFMQTVHYMYDRQNFTAHPALSLQELRTIAQSYDLHHLFRMKGADRIESWSDVVTHMTAPELAAWIIERLEEQQ